VLMGMRGKEIAILDTSHITDCSYNYYIILGVWRGAKNSRNFYTGRRKRRSVGNTAVNLRVP
jgi:hypothetical protein